MTTSTEITDFSGLGPFHISYRPGIDRYTIRAKVIRNQTSIYLHDTGKVYDVLTIPGIAGPSSYWPSVETAQRFLDNWLASRQQKTVVTCTCNSIDLFNQGCTCGFLQRSTP